VPRDLCLQEILLENRVPFPLTQQDRTMVLQMLNKKMPLHGTIFRQNVPCVNSQKSFSGQHGVGALPWDKVLFFTFQQIQYNIEVLFAKVRGIHRRRA